MTDNMIDRVAAAIHSVEGVMIPFAAMREDSELKRGLRLKARAAIEAMREPTGKMKIAGSIDPGSGGPDEGYETEVWQAMIGAALEAQS